MNFAFSPPSPKHNTSLVWNLSAILVKSGGGWRGRVRVPGRGGCWKGLSHGRGEEVSPLATSPTSALISVKAAVLLEDFL